LIAKIERFRVLRVYANLEGKSNLENLKYDTWSWRGRDANGY
jgi:hypothetical protein